VPGTSNEQNQGGSVDPNTMSIPALSAILSAGLLARRRRNGELELTLKETK
jgi:hypothetical protein